VDETHRQLDFLNLTSDQYRLLVETIGAVIWRADIDSLDFSYVSPQAEKLFHYPLEDWVKDDFWKKIIHKDDAGWVLKACQEATEENREHTMEYRITDGNGKIRWVRDSIKLHWEDGVAVEKIGVLVDVTEECEGREKLKRSEEKFSKAFNSCPIPATISRVEDSLLVNANDAFIAASGYSKDKLIGKKATDLGAWADEGVRDKIKVQIQQGHQVARLPIVMKDGRGRERHLVISATAIEVEKEDCMLAMFIDLTDSRKQERRLRDLSHELETFMYRASHNLKGPVASIKGLIYLAQKEVKDAQACYYLDLLKATSLTLENTLEELLDITRLKQGKLEIKRVNLDDLIDQVCRKLHLLTDWKDVTLNRQLDSHTINTDFQLLFSIVFNLVENAIRYREPGRKTIVDIRCSYTTDFVLEIKDNGRGIPESFQEKVFDMFFRANEQAQGIGLGLYIVKNAVEKLGGEISLNSEVDVGTIVRIQLPDMPYAERNSV
jgi:PAS domain S-box-containing protein